MTSRSAGKRNKEDWLSLAILEARIRGGSIKSISNDLHVTIWKVRKTIDLLNTQARAELDNSILSSVPLAWKASIELYRLVSAKAWDIHDKSADPRVKLQSLNTVMEANACINQLVEDSRVISQGIGRIEQSNKKVLDTHSSLMTEAKGLRQDLKDTGILPSPSPSETHDSSEEEKEKKGDT